MATGSGTGTPASGAGSAAYISHAQLIKAYDSDKISEYAIDTEGDAITDSAPVAVIDEAIANGDALIDSYLDSRYTVPLTAPVHARIRGLSAAAAMEFLYRRRPPYDDANAEAYRRLIDELEKIADGTIEIPGLTVASNLAYSIRDETYAPDLKWRKDYETGTDPLSKY